MAAAPKTASRKTAGKKPAGKAKTGEPAKLTREEELEAYRIMLLIRRFEEKTGCPMVINTSFNIRGEPIVCTPEDAYRCFMATDMDVLVMENCVLFKNEQPRVESDETERYLARFELD